jgi:LytTr DNA-binding domain
MNLMAQDLSWVGSRAWGEALDKMLAAEFSAQLVELEAPPAADVCGVLMVGVFGSAPAGASRISRPLEPNWSKPVVAVVSEADDERNEAWAEYFRQLLSTPQLRDKLNSILQGSSGRNGSVNGASLLDSRRKRSKPPKIAIRKEGKIVFIDPSDVVLIEAQGNYVSLQTRSRSHLLRASMSTIAKKLEPYGFVRIHRSTIVNEDFAEEVHISRSGDMLLSVKGGTKEYNVSRKYRNALKSIAPCWI